jgi:hypothetical protein
MSSPLPDPLSRPCDLESNVSIGSEALDHLSDGELEVRL